ncbi:MAG: adenine phosphoribosyltransferase, partial [Gallionellaceae bacterium]|nr:adenine phosphoribosyltransferase [Gallionellaceae bacterium]
ISPLLKNAEALDFVSHHLGQGIDLAKIDYFAGIESRGFILAAHLAATHKKGFLPIRKAGKLPPPTEKLRYALEYGTAEIELAAGHGRIMVVDDVLATGGTLQAALELGARAGYVIAAVAVLIDLKFLNTMTFNGKEVFSLVQYE